MVSSGGAAGGPTDSNLRTPDISKISINVFVFFFNFYSRPTLYVCFNKSLNKTSYEFVFMKFSIPSHMLELFFIWTSMQSI